MKVNVVYNTTDAPHGGGNQFLKALKSYFASQGALAPEEEADVILFNSHHNISRVIELKNRFANKKFIHRVDGPMRLYNDMSDVRDHIVYQANDAIADGTVFQSNWSFHSNVRLGMKQPAKHAVIRNAVDHLVFNEDKEVEKNQKLRMIAASFSPNVKKGFRVYDFLDKNLDFKKYDMVFAGNSPIQFKNIKNLGCLTSQQLAKEMNKSHLYITASENDPCSNSLLEAMACNLPAVVRKSGGHEEILRQAGSFFEDDDDVIKSIEEVASNIESFKEKIVVTTIDQIGDEYLSFFRKVLA